MNKKIDSLNKGATLTITELIKRRLKRRCIPILITGILAIFLTSCSGNIGQVKKGRLNYDTSTTIGKAFDNYEYFSKVKWDSFKDDQKREYVQMTATMDIKKLMKDDYVFFIKTMQWFVEYRNKDEEKSWHNGDPFYPNDTRSELVHFLKIMATLRESDIPRYLDTDSDLSKDIILNNADVEISNGYNYNTNEAWGEDELKILNLIKNDKFDEARNLFYELIDYEVDTKNCEYNFICLFLVSGKKNFEFVGSAFDGVFTIKNPDLSESFFADFGSNTFTLHSVYNNVIMKTGNFE